MIRQEAQKKSGARLKRGAGGMLIWGRRQGLVRHANVLIDFQAAWKHGGIGLGLSLCFRRRGLGDRWHVPAHKGESCVSEDFLTIDNVRTDFVYRMGQLQANIAREEKRGTWGHINGVGRRAAAYGREQKSCSSTHGGNTEKFPEALVIYVGAHFNGWRIGVDRQLMERGGGVASGHFWVPMPMKYSKRGAHASRMGVGELDNFANLVEGEIEVAFV